LLIGLVVAVFVFAWSRSRTAAQFTQTQGEQIFQNNCSGCHGNQGEGSTEGPSLHALPASTKTTAGIAEILQTGLPNMPAFADKLSDSEMQAVAEYIVAQFATTGRLGPGGELFRTNCAACHGVTLRGGALIYSDENAPSLIDVSAPEVVAAARSGPGTMPAFNAEALSDQQMASITSYIQALQSPPRPGGLDLEYPGPVTEGFVAVVFGLGTAVLAALWVERGGRG
jgi:ubiquinol-cytochrome c reductase cytochrome c subunit